VKKIQKAMPWQYNKEYVSGIVSRSRSERIQSPRATPCLRTLLTASHRVKAGRRRGLGVGCDSESPAVFSL